MKKDPFKEYIRQIEPGKRERGYAWHTAIGLQAVDGLTPSKYLVQTAIQNIEGEITIDQAQKLLDSYYEENPKDRDDERTEEADKVSIRIAKLLSENAWYFRNALVRANYNDLKKGVHETTEFLELFLRNLMMDEKNELHNRTMHISETFCDIAKQDIEKEKQDIETEKQDIDIIRESNLEYKCVNFSSKTMRNIRKLYDDFGCEMIFARADVMQSLKLTASPSSELLKKMLAAGIIIPVSGKGKGKYIFQKSIFKI